MFKATAIILAGGNSSRMGEDKSLMAIEKIPMIEFVYKQLAGYFPEIIISCNHIDKFTFLNAETVADENEDNGPLMGIVSSVAKSVNAVNFVTACDMPDVNIDLIAEMLSLSADYDVVVPLTAEERYEPLFAVYRKSILTPARRMLSEGNGRITALFKFVSVRYVKLSEGLSLTNINNKNDYNTFISKKVKNDNI